MFEVLSFGTQYFIYKRLETAGMNKFVRYIFIAWAAFWIIAGAVCGFDFSYVEYDIFSLHTNEIIKSLATTWTIITLFGFFAFLLVDLLTGFSKFNGKKILCALLLTLILTLYSMAEAYFVRTRELKIFTDKLPEDINKIRITYLTDVHIGGLYTHWHFERVMKLVNESKPDMFILTGDIIDGDMSYRERELKMLSDAAREAPLGAFAVNGNHEHYLILDEDVEGIIRDCGFNLLIDERVEAAGITIIGLDDNKHGWLKTFLKPEDENKFVLVLKHRPGLPFDAENKFDLQISGHTHGGQFWPLGYFKNMASKSTQGLSKKSGGYVYVSNGAGYNGAMMRLFAPPEVTVIDIVRK